MSKEPFNVDVKQPVRFGGDYLFQNQSLPNNATVESAEYTLNNTLGRLQLTGTIDAALTMAAGNTLSVVLQVKDGVTWKDSTTLLSQSGVATFSAGQIFGIIPIPNDTQRIYRLKVTSNFNASAVKLTATVATLPLA